ncbi:MAG: hypothetical protein IPM00_06710 [Tetrasphaera sp.]|nr:hypothetical protein [Tetrasphaera sp.]
MRRRSVARGLDVGSSREDQSVDAAEEVAGQMVVSVESGREDDRRTTRGAA